MKDEFDAFLECGIQAHGFLWLRCGNCGHDKLLAFSCKPGCCPRREGKRAFDRLILAPRGYLDRGPTTISFEGESHENRLFARMLAGYLPGSR